MNKGDLDKLLDDLLATPATSSPIARPAALPLATCNCGGGGYLHVVDAKGNRAVQECSCRAEARIKSKLDRAEIPERYRQSTLDNYDALSGDASLGRGLGTARRYADEYPVGTAGRGLLFVGPVGVGKTHLAVGILRQVVLEKGARGLFVDFRDLLTRIKRTFGKTDQSEDEILDPVYAADVVVLDELGAAQVTDWTFDRVEQIIGRRYNDRKSTIITTNLANLAPLEAVRADDSEYGGRAKAAMRGETLGDRIGARMHSRLQEMCRVVEMTGDDFRAKRGKR
jgi:DNA replication protein DnaC